MPPVLIESETLAIDWNATVGGTGRRELTPIDRKLERKTYTNSLEVGIKDGRMRLSSGLLNTQGIEDVIRGLVNDARFQRDFDDLPIPFRATATDMVSGELVILGSGDLSIAMRASMAAPGAFAPVISGDRVLSDGGLTRNLPVDVARDLCADIVIAVWLSSPTPDATSLMSPLALVSRSMDVMIDANVELQIASLTDNDVAINVPMGDIGSTDFGRGAEALVLGRAAAEAVAEQLRRYALPEDEYDAWRASVDDLIRDEVRLAEVRIVGLKRVNPKLVRAQIKDLQPGVLVREQDVVAGTDRIFALGDFERVEYRFSGPPNARLLEFFPIEKSWGPNFFRGDLGLVAETDGELMAILRVDHDLTWLNSLGGRWHNAIQVGRQTILTTDFYQPLDARQRFFVQPILMYDDNLEDFYLDGEREARYDLRQMYGEIDLGANVSTLMQLRTGVRVGQIDVKPDIGITGLPEINSERESSGFVSGVLDTRDNVGLPTKGSYAALYYANSGTWLGGEREFSVAEGVFTRAWPLRNNSLNVVAAAGEELSGSLPPTRDFRIGGIRSFPGLRTNELRGTSYWLAGAHYRQKVADIMKMFDQVLYAGVRLQAGRVGGRRDNIQEGTLFGISGNLSGRTPVGAFILSLGYASNNSLALQFALGAPLREGSGLDQTN